MDCIRPGEVSQDDLIAYIDGEAPMAVAQHIHACPSCAAGARDYARVQFQLRERLRPGDHPSPHTLGEYELGLLAAGSRTRVAAHLRECARCAQELRALRVFLAQEPPVPAPGPLERIRRVVTLLLAPVPPAAVAGLRGAVSTTSQSYQAEGFTVTVSLEFDRRRQTGGLTGLIWQESADLEAIAGRTVTLFAADGSAQMTAIDDLGNFAIEPIRPGSYRLEVTLDDRLLVLERLPMGDASPPDA